MTPVEIEVLLRCYYARGEGLPSTAAVSDAQARLVDLGLVEPVAMVITPRGIAHVRQLKALPLPRQVWIGSDGMVLG